MRTLRALVGLLGPLVLSAACTSTTVRTVDMSAPNELSYEIAEDQLLDVGVALFDPNVPESFAERDKRGIVPEVRAAEANFMPYVMKEVLQSTGNWGAVRVIPRPTDAVDLTVHGRIEESTGERLRLHIKVTDATGRIWIDKPYEALSSKYAYEEASAGLIDAFHTLYREVANDMLEVYTSLDSRQRAAIRRTAELRFAADFSPEAFAGYVEQRGNRYLIVRLPAEDDPMLARARRIREREYLFIDTLDSHYANFHQQMADAYNSYRRSGYEDAIKQRELSAQALRRGLAGAASIVGGIAATAMSDQAVGKVAGQVAIAGGATLIIDSFNKRAEAQLRREALMELGHSLDAEITPHVIELENQQLRLTGTVDEQYEQWREILRRIYFSEVGLDGPMSIHEEAPTQTRSGSDESG